MTSELQNIATLLSTKITMIQLRDISAFEEEFTGEGEGEGVVKKKCYNNFKDSINFAKIIHRTIITDRKNYLQRRE